MLFNGSVTTVALMFHKCGVGPLGTNSSCSSSFSTVECPGNDPGLRLCNAIVESTSKGHGQELNQDTHSEPQNQFRRAKVSVQVSHSIRRGLQWGEGRNT
jgi:hypothetical protein